MHRFIASEVPPVLSTTLFCNLRTYYEMRRFLWVNLSQHQLLHLGTRQIRQRETATGTALTLQEETNGTVACVLEGSVCMLCILIPSLSIRRVYHLGYWKWRSWNSFFSCESCCLATCPDYQIYQANQHDFSRLLSV